MKILKYLGIGLLVCGVLFAAAYFIKTNSKSVIEYETQTPKIVSIEREAVVTGKVIPEDEVEIKPQISGIISKLYVEEGDLVNNGDLLAKIKVIPNEQSLNSAQGRLANSKIVLKNAELDYKRNKQLFDSEIISRQEFENSQLNYSRAKQDVSNARTDLQIIKLGSAGGSSIANTNIRATVAGTILEIPVKEGDQVVKKIKTEKQILPFVTHDIMSNYNIFSKLKIKIKFISVYRSPVELVYSWIKRGLGTRLGTDPRIFTLVINKGNKSSPWYLNNLQKVWKKLNR